MIDFDGGDKSKRAPIGATNFVVITLVIAILSIACYFVATVGAVVFGAAGLMLGGYCMGFVRRHADGQKTLMAISGIALFVSVVAFMLGFLNIVDSL